MKVDLFTIGNFTIHTYGLMIAIGVILCVIVAMKRAEKYGLDKEKMVDIAILLVITGFLGAKLLFMLENWKDLVKDPMSVIGSSGFVVYGGIIVGLICYVIFCKIKHLSCRKYLDLAVPSVSLAQGFGRLGCFFAGCCYGKETDAWWGITFTNSPYAPNGVSLVPTQLLSSAGNFIIMAVLMLFAAKCSKKKVGDVTALYLTLYGCGRFVIEFFRTNTQGGIGPFTTAQCISFVIIAVGILFFIIDRVMPHKEKPAEAADHESDVEATA